MLTVVRPLSAEALPVVHLIVNGAPACLGLDPETPLLWAATGVRAQTLPLVGRGRQA
ncbi:MAG: hypothetical protein AB1578_19605 [Thermodesulfobacteriota bacterium]